DNANNEVGFRIERCQGMNCTNFLQIGTRTTNSTSFLNTGLTPNSLYRFRVRAYNSVGNSAYSNVFNLDTTIKPAAPTNLTAASYYTGLAVTIYWTDNANNEVGFRIERCQGANCTNFLEVGTRGANSTSFLNTGLARNTLYRYRVRSYNKAGNSGYSNIASVTTK
ncbi:MAG TPA: fibronectin type III domain-containing protein, partial [Pyrinomonadaceae bacterium]|nr:fibronectin type III domain-containing protein [Pyrinomonadaceae bacterium]